MAAMNTRRISESCKIPSSSAPRAEGRNTASDVCSIALAKEGVSSIGLAKEECRGYNARRAVHACADVAAPLCWGVFAAKPPSVVRLQLSEMRP